MASILNSIFVTVEAKGSSLRAEQGFMGFSWKYTDCNISFDAGELHLTGWTLLRRLNE